MAKHRHSRQRRRFWAVRVHSGCPKTVQVPAGQSLYLSRACLSEDQQHSSGGCHHATFQASCVSATGATPGKQDIAAFNFAFLVEEGGRNLSLRLPCGFSWQLQVTDKGASPKSPMILDILGYTQGETEAEAPCVETSVPARQRDLRKVHLPAGWTALSLKSAGEGRLVVTDVPKACFSSATFGASAAPQVANVATGDEIVEVNGFSLPRLAEQITATGGTFNTCQSKHLPGSVGKLQSPPCVSCDFIRRLREYGLDLALQMWLRVVKQEMPITLGVCSPASPAKRPRDHPHESRQSPGSTTSPARPAGSGLGSPVGAAAIEEKEPSDRQAVRYNPLKPAASPGAPLQPARVRQDRPVRGAVTQLAGGLSFEELPPRGGVACGDEKASMGQEVELRFAISTKGSKPKVVERGQVSFQLGDADLKDGWVDGNLNIEEVLRAWAPAILGMRTGQRRRLLVPGRLGFRDGGEVLTDKADLSVELELKQVK
ncbi:unnamed protein product [Symbiodinium natans]|uniref:peptidylprolyl isomerase n=1 Tax=Symbiodinium natans TaxID=878477 RepID=A0A812H055_9DINO|nr:unnamed protein product [Symbiodinium natans]